MAARTVRQTPSRLTSITRSHSSAPVARCCRAPARCRRWRRRRRGRRALDRARHRRLDLIAVADVGGDRDRPATDPPRRGLGLGGVEIDQRDRRAAELHLPRRLEADAPRRPGHERDLAVQVVGRHRAGLYRAVRRLRSRWADSARSRQSSAFPSWRSGCWSAGARPTSSGARSPTARAPRSGASTRARRPPTAAPAPTTSSPACSRTSIRATARCAATASRARRAGTATGSRSSSRSRRSWGSPPSRRSRPSGSPSSTQRCRESVFAYVEDWNRLTERIGFWIDLDDAYVTLDADYIESVWWSLRQIWDAGRLYQGHKVVPYCPRCGTALSSHEVALGYRDVEDPSVYVRLPVEAAGPLRDGDALLVWTTTPWTLISNAAVAVNPEMTYVRARVGEEVVVVAAAAPSSGSSARRPRCSTPSPAPSWPAVAYSPPFDYVTDFGPRGHTVLEADFVTAEEGTGLVHTAIAFGEDDFRLGEQYGLTLQNPVTLEGTFDERVGGLRRALRQGRGPARSSRRWSARGRLFRAHHLRARLPALLALRDAAALLRQVELVRAHLGGRASELLANNREIGWHPEHIRTGRFGKWLENNVDWALSRDRYWGTPLPIWECGGEDCEERFCAGSVAELRERAIGEVPDDLHRPYIDEVRLALRELRRRDGAGRIGDRHLVRQRRHALRPVPLPLREPARPSRSASRPTSSARRSTRPAAGSTPCWPSRRCCSTPPATATASASASSSTPRGRRCRRAAATWSSPGT